jgi:hypothetical protein
MECDYDSDKFRDPISKKLMSSWEWQKEYGDGRLAAYLFHSNLNGTPIADAVMAEIMELGKSHKQETRDKFKPRIVKKEKADTPVGILLEPKQQEWFAKVDAKITENMKRSDCHRNLTPRKIPMTGMLHEVLSRRYQNRDAKKPWVFWRVYEDRSTGKKTAGPFQYRKEVLISLCAKANVRYFTYHAIRHAGASLMDRNNAPIGAIQKILGHENRRTTEIYLHSIDNAEAEAIAIYEEARQKSHTSHTQNASSGNEKGVNQDG